MLSTTARPWLEQQKSASQIAKDCILLYRTLPWSKNITLTNQDMTIASSLEVSFLCIGILCRHLCLDISPVLNLSHGSLGLLKFFVVCDLQSVIYSPTETASTCCANPAFNTAACQRYNEDTINSAPPPPLPIIDRDGNEPFVVESILSQRLFHRQKQFLVKWQGYKEPTWEPVGYLLDESHTPIVPRQKFLHSWFWMGSCVIVLTDYAVSNFLVLSPCDVLCYLSRFGIFPCTCMVCDQFTLALTVSNCS